MSRVRGKPYFVYVLWSAGGRCFYIGISEDPDKRLRQHNESGRGWSSRHRPWEMVHSERYDGYTEARLRELELKSQKGGEGFYRLTGLNPSHFSHSTPSGS